MNFKEEYKKETQSISPSEEQCERIREGVMKRLSENMPDIPAKKKKPLYLKIAAVSGTAVCAAAVLIAVFTGIRHGVFLESSDNVTGGHYVNNEHNYGGANGANAPSYDDDILGSISGSHSIGKDNAQSSSISAEGEDSGYSTGSGHTTSPSGAINQQSSDTDGNGAVGGAAQDIPYLTFSEDNSICEVTMYGDTVTYRSFDAYTGGEVAENMLSANSNLGTKLFVRFDENIMVVFTIDGTVFGVYIE